MKHQFLHYDSRTRHLTLRDLEPIHDRLTWGDILGGILAVVALALCFIYLAIIVGFLQPDFVR